MPEARENAGDQVAIGFKSNLRLSLFYFISPYDWYRKLASLSQPIRFKTEIYSWLDHPPLPLGSLLVFLMSSHWLFLSSFDRSRKFSKPITGWSKRTITLLSLKCSTKPWFKKHDISLLDIIHRYHLLFSI